MTKVMLVDDDASMQVLIEQIVRRGGYDFCCAGNGADGLEMLRAERPDFLILDVMLPDINGFEICEIIRGEGREVPIMFLTAKGDIVDKRIGYGIGGDDYLVKPFSGEELRLRVGALLRRAQIAAEAVTSAPQRELYRVGDLEVNVRTGNVRLAGKRIELTPKESRIMAVLASHPGEVYSKRDLIEEIWGEEYLDSAIAISVYIRRIRAKLEPDPSEPRYVQTVWHCGYRLTDEGGEERDEFEE